MVGRGADHDLDAVVDAVVVGVGEVRTGAPALLLEVGEAVAVAVLLVVGDAVAVGVLDVGIGAGEVLVEVVEAVAVEVGGGVGRVIGIEAIEQLPPVGDAVAVAVDVGGRDGAVGLDHGGVRGDGGGVGPAGVPVVEGGGEVLCGEAAVVEEIEGDEAEREGGRCGQRDRGGGQVVVERLAGDAPDLDGIDLSDEALAGLLGADADAGESGLGGDGDDAGDGLLAEVLVVDGDQQPAVLLAVGAGDVRPLVVVEDGGGLDAHGG